MKSLLLFLLLGITPGFATTFFERPFPEVVKDAPIIVRGIVGNTYADWGASADKTRRIYTFYEMRLSEVIKGPVEGKSLLMREMGGQKDGIGLQIAGSAHFEPGEEVVVFLNEKNNDGSHDLRGMVMGKMNIEKDANGQEVLTGAAISGDEHSQGEHRHETDGGGHREPEKKWTLNALRSLVDERTEDKTPEKHADTANLESRPQPKNEAPQLQSSKGEELQTSSTSVSTKSGNGLLWSGLGVLIFLGLLIWLFRRKS